MKIRGKVKKKLTRYESDKDRRVELMSGKIKITIIIPIYNAEKYLRQCLKSIISQTILPDLEIICIDDGSSDNSIRILNEYSQMFPQIIVFQQVNQGSGPARNRGMEIARGKYLCFLDADDFYPSAEALEMLYQAAEREHLKICGGSMYYVNEDGEKLPSSIQKLLFNKEEKILYADFQEIFFYQRFIYQTELIKKYEIYFPPYLRYQDPPFLLKAMVLAQAFFAIPQAVYCYRTGHQKGKLTDRQVLDMLYGIKDVLDLSEKYHLKRAYIKAVDTLDAQAEMLVKHIFKGQKEIESGLRHINACICWSLCAERDEKNIRALQLIQNKEWLIQQKYVVREQLAEGYHLFLYGAGTVGTRLERFLREKSYCVDAFIVTEANGNFSEINGVPVKGIEECEDIKKKSIVIIATTKYQKEIKKKLERYGVLNYYMSDEMVIMLDLL